MAKKSSDEVEGIVLNFVNEQNMPLSSQNVTHSLKKLNLKKKYVQKALGNLAVCGKISYIANAVKSADDAKRSAKRAKRSKDSEGRHGFLDIEDVDEKVEDKKETEFIRRLKLLETYEKKLGVARSELSALRKKMGYNPSREVMDEEVRLSNKVWEMKYKEIGTLVREMSLMKYFAVRKMDIGLIQTYLVRKEVNIDFEEIASDIKKRSSRIMNEVDLADLVEERVDELRHYASYCRVTLLPPPPPLT
ncbi:unnamed protein product [Rhodiola kirilowii]